MSRPLAAAALCCALTLAGCIDSAKPILTDAKPMLGERLRLQLYALREGAASEPQRVTYAWTGQFYKRTSRGKDDLGDFTLHEFENGDLIAQTVPRDDKHTTEFAVIHPLANGIYFVLAVDEDDADQATRDTHCAKQATSGCRIETREALAAFARATLARKKPDGGLAIRLASGKRSK